MTTSPERLKEMYQALGKLFYAMAAADKTVRKEEIEALKKIVKTKLLDFEDSEDEFGTDSAYQIEIVFMWLIENDSEATVCFNEFKAFNKQHKSLFTNELNHVIFETASAIAASFSGKNKSELVMLSELGSVLEGNS